MIKVTDSNGYQQLINPMHIVRVSGAGQASRYNGTRSHIRLVSESICIDCQQSVGDVQKLLEAVANGKAADA